MEDVVVHIRPEFLDEVGGAVDPNLEDPFLPGLGPGAFPAGVVKVGNSRSRAVADNLREVESVARVVGCGQVGAGDEEPAD